jgi:predicted NAD/FAD-binding protein
MLVAAHSTTAATKVTATASLNPLINKCKRIAICGCGVTGSIISNLLSKHDSDRYSIHVFEAGRGPGGRSATRHYEGYNFDHG